jgi:hypothetical protein
VSQSEKEPVKQEEAKKLDDPNVNKFFSDLASKGSKKEKIEQLAKIKE